GNLQCTKDHWRFRTIESGTHQLACRITAREALRHYTAQQPAEPLAKAAPVIHEDGLRLEHHRAPVHAAKYLLAAAAAHQRIARGTDGHHQYAGKYKQRDG